MSAQREDRRTAFRMVVEALIREHRRSAGLSQAAVAERAGITQAGLSNYELGKRDIALVTLVNVLAAVGTPSVGQFIDLATAQTKARLRAGRAA
jgi:transcriptional regulator with XRE-family HTH domain